MAPKKKEDVLKSWNAIKPPGFCPTSSNVLEIARQWKHQVIKYENYFEIIGLTEEDDDNKVSIIKLQDYDFATKADKSIDDNQVASQSGSYKKLIEKLNIYFEIKTLLDYARNKLSSVVQKEGQSANDLLVEIQDLITDAGWKEASNATQQIKTVLLRALKSDVVRQQYQFSLMLGKTELTLADIVQVAKVVARSPAQHQVKAVRQYKPKQYRPQGNRNQFRRNNQNRNRNQNQNQNQPKPCYGCGSRQHQTNKDPKCPAKNIICNICKKTGHFANQCFSAKDKKRNYNRNRRNQYVKRVDQESNPTPQNPGTSRAPGSANDNVTDRDLEALQVKLANQVIW